jgi:hypothetical protein
MHHPLEHFKVRRPDWLPPAIRVSSPLYFFLAAFFFGAAAFLTAAFFGAAAFFFTDAFFVAMM